MSQLTSGWRSILSLPKVYGMCRGVLGKACSRRELVDSYIRPKIGMRVLDLGCGPASILDYLPLHIEYVGIDASHLYIATAKEKYGDRGCFHCMPLEAVRLEGLDKCDIVMGLGVLHHLDDAQAAHFFSLSAQVLHDKGRCLTLDPCLVDGQHWIARWLIGLDRGRNVRKAEGYQALALQSFQQVNQTIRHDLMRVPYTHLIMECRK